MKWLTVVSFLALSACAGNLPSPPPANNLSAFAKWLNSLNDADLTAGIQIANADGLKADVQCLSWFQAEKGKLVGGSLPQVVGPISAFEVGRGALASAGSGGAILSDFNFSCAAMANDINFTLVKFGIIAAGTTATGGAVAPILPILTGGVP